MTTEAGPTIKIEGLMPRVGSRPVTDTFRIKTEVMAHTGTIQKILAEDDPLLSSISEIFDFENPKFMHPISLTQSLIMSMRAYGCVGLAAVQVGMPVRVFVVGFEQQNQVFFNPEILARSPEKSKTKEGCISFPFCFVNVERANAIRIKYQNEEGVWHETDYSGYTARIIQHEYDHLDGKTLKDHTSNFTWKLVKEKSRGLYKKAVKLERQKRNGTVR